jgi:hypothetical protein
MGLELTVLDTYGEAGANREAYYLIITLASSAAS